MPALFKWIWKRPKLQEPQGGEADEAGSEDLPAPVSRSCCTGNEGGGGGAQVIAFCLLSTLALNSAINFAALESLAGPEDEVIKIRTRSAPSDVPADPAPVEAVPAGLPPASCIGLGGGVLGIVPINGARAADDPGDTEPSDDRSDEITEAGLEATPEEAGNVLPAMGLASVAV